jgi:leucyl aminopeptidase
LLLRKKEAFEKNVAFIEKQEFSNELEAKLSGLLLGTYNLGHFKKWTSIL